MFGFFKRLIKRPVKRPVERPVKRPVKRQKVKAHTPSPTIYINTHRRNQDSDRIDKIIASDSDIFADFEVLTTDDIAKEDDESEEATL